MTPNQHAWLAALTGCALLLFGGGVMSAEPADSGQFGDYQLKGFRSDYSHLAPDSLTHEQVGAVIETRIG